MWEIMRIKLRGTMNKKSQMTSLFVVCNSVAVFLILLGLNSCAFFGVNTAPESVKPISNPFAEYTYQNHKESTQNMVLRTKKGDRTVELEIPGDQDHLSDFAIPMSPSFRESNRPTYSMNDFNESTGSGVDESYKDRSLTRSDYDIIHQFPQGSPLDADKRKNIEQGLNLAPSLEGPDLDDKTPSYLAGIDRIKQLYHHHRYEAALIETDGMVSVHQTDPRLHEMRGTLLDRLGKRELAIQSWQQALKLRPENKSLRRLIQRRQTTLTSESTP